MKLFDRLRQSVGPTHAAVPPSKTPAHEVTVATTSTETGGGQPAPARQVDWRVLFVGVDPFWFIQIERDALCLQPTWFYQRAENTAEALALLETAPFDTLILDGRHSEVADLLRTLEKKLARTMCLVRCDLSDRSATAQWRQLGATPIQGNLDAATLIANIKRADRLRGWMGDPAIKKMLPLIHKLPTAPKLHAQVTEELQSPNGSMEVVAASISRDPVMSAKLLQVANSAFFGRAREVTDASEAVMVLGAERIRSLILLASVFSQYDGTKCPGFSPEPIWSHSVQVGVFARSITFAETREQRMAEAAFTAGLLHDIGKLILAGNLPEIYETVLRLQVNKKISDREAEQIVMGITHAEVGACLLATWNLPLPILEAIAWHHQPERSTEKGFSLLAAVHVANAFAHGENNGPQKDHSAAFLIRAGLADRWQRWSEVCGLIQEPHSTVAADRQRSEEVLLRRREAKEN